MKKIALASLLALLTPGLAAAHAGTHDSGFVMGLAHPIGGADHVLAMIAVGLWAALLDGRALWALPLAFVGALVAGAGLGAAGVALPMVEPMILTSVVVLGVAIALALRLPLSVAVAAVALFGLVHGHAHGTEGPAGDLAGYAIGFVIATASLHVAGLALGLGLTRLFNLSVLRAAGGATALAGFALALA
jgi:urease accessory protein